MTMPRLLGPLTAILLAVLSLPGAAAGPSRPFDSFLTFGDSLADIGNVWLTSRRLGIDPAPPPSTSPHRTYYQGRFSNGPVAFEYLWQRLSGQAPGSAGGLKPVLAEPIAAANSSVSYAFGGTGTALVSRTPGNLLAPGLKGQVELYRLGLRGRKPSSRALYAIVTGSNDYREDQMFSPLEVVQNIVDSVDALHQLGARDVMVLTVPDFGLLPGGGGPGSPESQLAALHNQLLKDALDDLSASRPKLRVILADINAVFALLPPGMDRTTPALDVMFPPQFLPPGFRMSLCLFIDPATCQDVPTFETNSEYVFWDAVHPTTDAHRLLGEYLYDLLQQ